MVSIVYFYDTVNPDVDNIPKRILDALTGLVFIDDTQVTDLVCRKRHTAIDPIINPPVDKLLERMYAGGPFTYVKVEEANVLEVNV